MTGVNIAIYNGNGVMGSSRIALTRMFEWMNATVEDITASQIIDGVLDDYDLLAIPGGSESTCSSELDSEGREKVISFVANGGSYFGICGGATFAVRYIHLFNGFMGPVGEPGELIHMTTMHVNQSSKGPDLSDFSENFTTMYYGSQHFTPNPYEATSIHTIATYDSNSEIGMVAFEYEAGTVFLSSPHPEYEEDSNRDDTTFGDDLTDPDSEWDLLLRVSKWLIDASVIEFSSSTTTTTTTTDISIPSPTSGTLDIPLIAGVSSVFVLAIAVVVVLYRRAH
ncbi:MAG: BPL-N domain-containing protein [Candidatus Thorarchaeota archaeon]